MSTHTICFGREIRNLLVLIVSRTLDLSGRHFCLSCLLNDAIFFLWYVLCFPFRQGMPREKALSTNGGKLPSGYDLVQLCESFNIRMYKVMGDASKTKKSSKDHIGITKNEMKFYISGYI